MPNKPSDVFWRYDIITVGDDGVIVVCSSNVNKEKRIESWTVSFGSLTHAVQTIQELVRVPTVYRNTVTIDGEIADLLHQGKD